MKKNKKKPSLDQLYIKALIISTMLDCLLKAIEIVNKLLK